jgi:hypothetical protein
MISQRRIRIAALVVMANAAVALQFLPSAQACVDECQVPKYICMPVATCQAYTQTQAQALCQQKAFSGCYAKCAFDCLASGPKGECNGVPAMQCNYKSTQSPACPVCAVPTNFHQTSIAALGVDIGTRIQTTYAWGSSTGVLADLQFCEVGESVDYPGSGDHFFYPSPPFPANTATGILDPTEVNEPGSDGGIGDNQWVPGVGAFVKPYSISSVTSTQIWRYRCPCANGGNWVTVNGPLSIVRTVSQNTNGSWKYTVTKPVGGSASFNPLPP